MWSRRLPLQAWRSRWYRRGPSGWRSSRPVRWRWRNAFRNSSCSSTRSCQTTFGNRSLRLFASCSPTPSNGVVGSTRQVRISCVRSKRMLLYRIADPGEGFDIEHLAHAAISNPEGNPFDHDRVRQEMGLRPGGLGLMMTRALVDELIYNEKRNEVILVKY